MNIPERLRAPPPGYPDLRIMDALEGEVGIPIQSFTSHLEFLRDSGTLMRLHHQLRTLAGLIQMRRGAPEFFDENTIETMNNRIEADPEFDPDEIQNSWSDAVH